MDFNPYRLGAENIGYPVIVKTPVLAATARDVSSYLMPVNLKGPWNQPTEIGVDLYNDGTFYLEKYIVRPVHVEVQVFNGDAIGIRKYAVQRKTRR